MSVNFEPLSKEFPLNPMYILPALLFGMLVGGLLTYIVFPRRLSQNGRPASVKRLKRGHWYAVYCLTGPRTISVWDPEEGREGEENPISVKLSLLDMLRPVGRWVRLVKRKGQTAPVLEFSEAEPADASCPKIHNPPKVEV